MTIHTVNEVFMSCTILKRDVSSANNFALEENREVWHYQDANIELIRKAIDGFNWQKAFSNKNVNQKVDTFDKTILNILTNFIPHETITCDDRDPPWFNENIKSITYIRKKCSI